MFSPPSTLPGTRQDDLEFNGLARASANSAGLSTNINRTPTSVHGLVGGLAGWQQRHAQRQQSFAARQPPPLMTSMLQSQLGAGQMRTLVPDRDAQGPTSFVPAQALFKESFRQAPRLSSTIDTAPSEKKNDSNTDQHGLHTEI